MFDFRPDWSKFPKLLSQGISKREIAARTSNFNSLKMIKEAARIKPARVSVLSALYFVTPEGEDEVCKIGIAADPWARLATLQTGCWKKLTIAGLFWYPDMGGAASHEYAALQLAKKEKVRLSGEWVNLDVDEAIGLVLTANKNSAHEHFTDSHGVVFDWFIECIRQADEYEKELYTIKPAAAA